MSHVRPITAAILFSLAITLTGCFSSNPEDIQAWVKPHEVNVTADRYIVQPPDELELRCTQVPELHMQRQRVRPDGKGSFVSRDTSLGLDFTGISFYDGQGFLVRKSANIKTAKDLAGAAICVSSGSTSTMP